MTQLAIMRVEELENIIAELPADKAQALMDFARYLQQKYTPHPQRGSADAILKTLEEVGPLQFEEGELASLLNDIEAMRQMDMLEIDHLTLKLPLSPDSRGLLF
ncbi:MAG: DUF2281 domain-containing protein [Candidatus Promineifilaceae bacterium]